MENLPGRGFGVICRACVSFAWEIVRDSPMVNTSKCALVIGAKSMLPGNAKCSMTSLVDTKHIFRERKMYSFIYEASNFAAGAARATRLQSRYARNDLITECTCEPDRA